MSNKIFGYDEAKVLGLVLTLVAASLTGYLYLNSTGGDEPVQTPVPNSSGSKGPTAETDYSVDCPDEVLNRCVELAKKYDANITHYIESQYTNRNGTAHKVNATSDSIIEEADSRTALIMFDEETGQIWNVR